MAITMEEVKKLADLARLSLSEDEMRKQAGELERILEYVGRLSAIDTAGVPEAEAPAMEHALREDEAFECDDVTQAFIREDFPEKEGELLKVPGVFEKPKGKRVGSRE